MVSALTQPAIRVLDLVTVAIEATSAVRDSSRGAHRSECHFIYCSRFFLTNQNQNCILNND